MHLPALPPPAILLSTLLIAIAPRASANGADGALDPTFDPQPDQSALTTPSLPDGRLILGGVFNYVGGASYKCLARVNIDEMPDAGFHADANAAVVAAVVLPDDRLIVGGSFNTIGGATLPHLARLGPDGTPDPSFDPGLNGMVWALALESSGSLLIGGEFTEVDGLPRPYLARILPDGSVDPSFHPDLDQRVLSIAVQPDGRMLIAGDFRHLDGAPANHLTRLLPDGTRDPGFSANPDSFLRCVALQADGRILIGGHFTHVDDQPRARFARLREDGSLDPEFMSPGADEHVLSIVVQTDGRIIASGYFHQFNGIARPNLARLHPDGTLDESFAPFPDEWVWSCFLQADGRLLVSGGFHHIAGSPRHWFARLTNAPATQALEVNNPARVIWRRGGSSPETHEVDFDLSVDGSTWTPLGRAKRIAGGWELDGLSLPAAGTIRASARICGGHLNASSGIVETQQPFTLLQKSPLVGNGGFEDGMTDWSATGNTSIQDKPPYRASEGNRCACFNDHNTAPGGSLTRSIETLPGRDYLLEFDVGTLAWNQALQELGVTLQGGTVLVSRTITVRGAGGGQTRWSTVRIPFTADSPSATLVFRDLSVETRSIDLLLDQVRVTPARPWLRVGSSPIAGAEVLITPSDVDGLDDGTTDFQRSYPAGATVSLTAPGDFAGMSFSHWLVDGAPILNSLSTRFTMDGDHQATAVFVGGPPEILDAPQEVAALPGGSVVFRVTARGTTPLTYAWLHEGTPVPGATGSELQLHDLRPEDAGRYEVVVSNTLGSVTAGPAQLTLLAGFTGIGNGSFEQQLNDWSATGNLVIQGPSAQTATDGTRSAAFNTGNSNPDGALTQCLATTPGQEYTLEFDIGTLAYTTGWQRLEVDVSSGAGSVTRTFNIQGTGGGKVRWLARTLDFTAGVGSTCITFRDRSSTSTAIDLLLDHVRMVPALRPRLANGGFESGAEAWWTSGHVEPRGGALYLAAEGSALMAFNTANTLPDGVIEQTFATTPGGTYTVRFRMGTFAYNTNPQQLEVEVRGTITTLAMQEFVLRGTGGGKTTYQDRSLTFTADGTSATLSFRDRSTTTQAIDLLLDDVRIE